MDRKPASRVGLNVLTSVLVILFLYFASPGPVVFFYTIAEKQGGAGLSWFEDLIESFYIAPSWLYDHWEPYGIYIEWWRNLAK